MYCLCRYSTLNEINKSKSDNRTVYIYFLTKLPRIEGGSAYIGFHGGMSDTTRLSSLHFLYLKLNLKKTATPEFKVVLCETIHSSIVTASMSKLFNLFNLIKIWNITYLANCSSTYCESCRILPENVSLASSVERNVSFVN